jgi:hypothetical protein
MPAGRAMGAARIALDALAAAGAGERMRGALDRVQTR